MRGLGKCKLNFVGVQEVRRVAMNEHRIIHFPMEKGKRIIG
jgi:hypothetical protein